MINKTENIVDYVKKYGKYTFDELPFNEVDSLVLSQLSYIRYDNIIGNFENEKPALTFKEMSQNKDFENIFFNVRDPSSNHKMVDYIIDSKRFENMYVNYYIEHTDPEAEKQFCAVSFFINNKFVYVSYRGTDASIVGWKEDFNMGFMPKIPSQDDGEEYLRKISLITNLDIVVGGHSKGGNIAVYASMLMDKKTQKRIKAIFNHDGPGFREEFLKSHNFKIIENKVHKTVPKSSVIGMFLQNHGKYRIVESNRFLFMQHDPFSWGIKDDDFLIYDSLTKTSKYMSKSLNAILCEFDDETRKRLTDVLFSIINTTNATCYDELMNNWKKNAIEIFKARNTVDKETKVFIIKTLASFAKVFGKSFFDFKN